MKTPVFGLIFFACFTVFAGLNVPITIKETAGVGVSQYPVSVVVPLEKGTYQDTTPFLLRDDQGRAVPAQFEILNRHWASDRSIRHLQVHFLIDLESFSGPQTGQRTFHLTDSGDNPAPAAPIQINDTAGLIEVDTGPLQFSINKQSFNMIHQVVLNGTTLIQPNQENGARLQPRAGAGNTRYDALRDDFQFEIEEAGPIRVVLKATAPNLYQSTVAHTPGVAVRIYAWAGSPMIKIDYQLQNSATNVRYAWPLYFEALDLNFATQLSNAEVRIGRGDGSTFAATPQDNGFRLAQEHHNQARIYRTNEDQALEQLDFPNGSGPEGFLDLRTQNMGVMASIRHFWQTWPNGLAADDQGRLSIQLFPEWSAKFMRNQNADQPLNVLSPSGLYWLDDMQQTYKEVLLFFHNGQAAAATLAALSQSFTHPPVASLPTQWYAQTAVTLDLDGVVPNVPDTDADTTRIPVHNGYAYDAGSAGYNFGWTNFYLDVNRKLGTASGGEWPYSSAGFIANRNPAEALAAEAFAMGELNIRPQWLDGYTFDEHFATLAPTPNPYRGTTWRAFEGHGAPTLDAPYLADTVQDANPRDDQHAWTYHMEETYYLTGNPWIRDWYRFIGEFRKTRLRELDPFPDRSSRGRGHALANALQAYRISGDDEILSLFGHYIREELRPEQAQFRHGGFHSTGDGREAAFQAGFLARTLIAYMTEVRETDPQAWAEAFCVVAGLVWWNATYCQYCHFTNAATQTGPPASYGTAATFVDVAAWYGRFTGDQAILSQLNQYLETGLNGGVKPYELDQIRSWRGNWVGRMNTFHNQNPKADTTPPDAVSDLVFAQEGDDWVLRWRAPADAAFYLVLHADQPITDQQTMDPNQVNWWAADVVHMPANPVAGAAEVLRIPFTGQTHAAIFVFDAAGNKSAVSCGDIPCDPPTCHYELTPASAQFGAAAANASFTVATAESCEWVAQAQAAWIHIISESGADDVRQGPGEVSYRLDANLSGAARSGVILVGDQTFFIDQGVDNQPPTVEILEPEDLAVVQQGSTLVLRASAQDAEDGDLSAAIEWVSSRQGSLGDGTDLAVLLEPGDHILTAMVTDQQGETAAAERSVRVNQLPTVSFDAEAQGVMVTFNVSVDDLDGDVTTYEWHFGDGAIATDPEPSHTFPGSGRYEVQLRVTDNDGGSAVATKLLELTALGEPPQLYLGASSQHVAAGDYVDITWRSSNAVRVRSSDASGAVIAHNGYVRRFMTGPTTLVLTAEGPGGLARRELNIETRAPSFHDLAPGSARSLGPYLCDGPEGDVLCRSITDFSGFVLDGNNRKLLLFGGGAGATFRDDIDAFDLDRLVWASLYQPTACEAMHMENLDADAGRWISSGHPYARHTFDLTTFIPKTNEFLLAAGSGAASYPSCEAGPASYPFGRIGHFDMQGGSWQFGAKMDRRSWPTSGSCEYDPVSGTVIFADAGVFSGYDPITRQITEYRTYPGPSSYDGHLVYFPPNGKMYYFQRGTAATGGEVQVFEMTLNRDNLADSRFELLGDLTGAPPRVSKTTGYAYDWEHQLIGGALNEGVFYAFDPMTRTWMHQTVQPDALGSTPNNLLFHHIDYDPAEKVFIFMDEARETWLLRFDPESAVID